MQHSCIFIAAYRRRERRTSESLQAVVKRFRFIAGSDDYLQWLLQVEAEGEFEKCARLEEIADAQQKIPDRLSTALASSVQDAMDADDFVTASKVVQLASAGSEELLDRMEDDLASRCKQLSEKN